MVSMDSPADALAAFNGVVNGDIGPDSGNFNVRPLAVSGIGDAAQAYYYNWTGALSGNLYEGYSVIFRRGLVVVGVDVYDDPGRGSADVTAGYARIIDARLTGANPAPVSITSPQPSAAPTGHLFQYSGTGDADTPTFTLPTSGANVCVQVSGTSPGLGLGPSFSLVFYQADGTIDSFPYDFNTSGCKIIHPDDGPGRYYLEIIATDWTNWSLTVDAQ